MQCKRSRKTVVPTVLGSLPYSGTLPKNAKSSDVRRANFTPRQDASPSDVPNRKRETRRARLYAIARRGEEIRRSPGYSEVGYLGFSAQSGQAENPGVHKSCFNSLDAPRDRFVVDSALEGTGFEPSVPLLRKALLGVANRRRRHERRSHLQVQVRNGNACLKWLPIAFPFVEGPRVRIRLPPPANLSKKSR
jgi:hypothetical protein